MGPQSKPTVLIGWELGGGKGHAQPLACLAHALAGAGCRPVLAVNNAAEGARASGDSAFPVLPAPQPKRSKTSPAFLAASYADILALCGYAAVNTLAPMVQDWQDLIDSVQPALVVCDHSPTLCLAAYQTIPTMVLGAGFSVPPASGPTFPALLPERQPLVPEAELLAVVREVQQLRGRSAPATLPGLFDAAERFVTVLPELDAYQGLRTESAIGPLENLPEPLPPPTDSAYFAYLGAEGGDVEAILNALSAAGHTGTAFVRGAPAEMRQRLQRPGLEVLDTPAVVLDVLPRSAVVIHHGGVGLSQAALAAGRPQMVVPRHLEQILTAQLLERLGAGSYLVGPGTVEAAPAELRELSRPAYAAQAMACARSIQRRGPWTALTRIVERCLALAR